MELMDNDIKMHQVLYVQLYLNQVALLIQPQHFLDFEIYFSCEGVILKGMTPFLTLPGDSFRNERTLRTPFFRDDRKSAAAFWGFP